MNPRIVAAAAIALVTVFMALAIIADLWWLLIGLWVGLVALSLLEILHHGKDDQ